MRTTPLARRLGSVALVAAMTLGLPACSSGDEDAAKDSSAQPDPGTGATDDEVAEGEGATDDEAPAESGASEEAPGELSAKEFYPSVMAALREAETFRFTTTTTSQGASSTMEGEARLRGDGMEMTASSTGAQAMEMVMLDQVIYLKSQQLGTGDKWLKVDLDGPEGSLMGMLGKATDPEVMFKAMRSPEKLEVLGEAEVDGVATQHYRITVDPVDYMEAMEFPAEMAGFMPEELVTEMWVDADDLPRRFTQQIEMPAAAGGQGSTSTTEGTYSDFGTDVEIEAPPASEISEQQFPGM